MPEYEFPLVLIFPCKERIEDSIFIWGNKGQRKLVFRHILCNAKWKILRKLS